jgi:hypothetical protein
MYLTSFGSSYLRGLPWSYAAAGENMRTTLRSLAFDAGCLLKPLAEDNGGWEGMGARYFERRCSRQAFGTVHGP